MGSGGFHRPLDGPGESQLNAHGPAVGLGQSGFRARPQCSLCRDGADQRVVGPAARKLGVESSFQPGHTVALAVEIPQQRCRQRGVAVPPRHRIAPHPQRRDVLPHVQQKRPGCVPLLVELRLPGGFGQGVQAGVAALPRQAEGQPAAAHAREQAAIAIVEVAPPGRERQPGSALGFRPGRVGAVGAEPEQAAQQYREGAEKGGVQRQHPATAHGLPSPFGTSRSVWPGKCRRMQFALRETGRPRGRSPNFFAETFPLRRQKSHFCCISGRKLQKKC